MTKTLTEQWKDGTLPDGYYYIRLLEIDKPYIHKKDYWAKEVPVTFCEPVPSYEEWKHTKEKLKKATELNCNHAYKTNKRRIQINNLKNENNQLREQLKEKNVKLNELRHQRNEANEVIRYYDIKEPKYVEDGVVVAKDPAHRYLEKWGVK